MKNIFGNSKTTSVLGIIVILWGLRVACDLWKANQTISFNLFHVEPGAFALIISGLGLIHIHFHRK